MSADSSANRVSNGMNDQSDKRRRILSLFVEFVKFSTGFAVIIATALIVLQAAGAAL